MRSQILRWVILFTLLALGGFFTYVKVFSPEATKEKQAEVWKERTNKSQQKDLQEGDILFHTSRSSQSKAIQLATHSEYSHCGVLFKKGDELLVLEAVQPVKYTPFDEWVQRGKNKHYVVKRLKTDSLLSSSQIEALEDYGKSHIGKNYDSYFEWSDDRMYCSELIWKMYKQTLDVELGSLQTLSDFDLENAEVKRKLKERFGDDLPIDEEVISPAALFESDLLYTVYEN